MNYFKMLCTHILHPNPLIVSPTQLYPFPLHRGPYFFACGRSCICRVNTHISLRIINHHVISDFSLKSALSYPPLCCSLHTLVPLPYPLSQACGFAVSVPLPFLSVSCSFCFCCSTLSPIHGPDPDPVSLFSSLLRPLQGFPIPPACII